MQELDFKYDESRQQKPSQMDVAPKATYKWDEWDGMEMGVLRAPLVLIMIIIQHCPILAPGVPSFACSAGVQ